MTSSMLAGERRWASARRGGMTVLGKVTVPKPLNLPSQRLENHGLDPNVEIVPKGTLSWGSRSSSSTSNAWGSSTLSPNADSTSSPSHLSGRPSSGSGTRPSTAGSDRTHESTPNAWGQSSRPSSASGALTTKQTSLMVLRPRSAETRPGSSQLSRFAEPSSENSVAWGPTGVSEKLGMISSKDDGFSLSSGDFPTLGSERENSGKSTDSQGGISVNTNVKSGTVNTCRRDDSQRVDDGVQPTVEKWQGEPPPYLNANVPPQHFDARHGLPISPPGVWYRGPPVGPPYQTPLTPGGFPIEPFPYYHPQIPPNSQPVPPPGTGPRGHHPKNGDLYRPHIPDAYICPGMPIRPGFYPGPVAYEGYYGPPMGYCNSNERDIPFMGMGAGTSVYNRNSGENAPDPSNNHARAGVHASIGKTSVLEQVGSGHPGDTRGPYKVLLKQHNEWDEKQAEDKWEHAVPANAPYLEKGDQPRTSAQKNEWGLEDTKNEEFYSGRRNFGGDACSRNFDNRGTCSSDSVKVKLPESRGKVKADDNRSVNKSDNAASTFPQVPQLFLATPKDPTLIQKVGLNAKAWASGGRSDVGSSICCREEQKSRLQVVDAMANHSANEAGTGVVRFERTHTSGNLIPSSHEVDISTPDKALQPAASRGTAISRRASHGAQGRLDPHGKRFNTHDPDGWQKKPLAVEPITEVSAANSEPSINVHVQDLLTSVEVAEKSGINLQGKDEGESLTPMFDASDCQAQRAKMREIAKQRAKQLQEEEEERIREQMAKALAKLEELNRRTQTMDGSAQKLETAPPSGPIQQEREESRIPAEPVTVASKSETQSSALDSNPNTQIREGSTIGVGEFTILFKDALLETSDNVHAESVVSHSQPLPLQQDAHTAGATDCNAAAPVNEGSVSRHKLWPGNRRRLRRARLFWWLRSLPFHSLDESVTPTCITTSSTIFNSNLHFHSLSLSLSLKFPLSLPSMEASPALSRIGLAGLAVMGQNLALNIADKGFPISVYNRTTSKVDETLDRAHREGDLPLTGQYTPRDFVLSLQRPRSVIILVKAGFPVDQTIAALSEYMEAGDTIIDGGNEWYENTERRMREVADKGILYLGMGVSGGEEGARNGPSLMPGGSYDAYLNIEDIVKKVAAQVEDGPCVTYIGEGGSGNFVKMVHNGIEYGDMQLISEAYDVLKNVGGLSNAELAEIFSDWNRGELESFLIEITADIFKVKDEHGEGELVDQILDKTGMKGTGKWTVQQAAELSVAAPTIAASLDCRYLSGLKEERVAAAELLKAAGLQEEVGVVRSGIDKKRLIDDVRQALYASKICSYAQGMNLLRAKSVEKGWNLNFGELARIWKGGCIIRAVFLDRIKKAHQRNPNLASLVVDPEFAREMVQRQAAWRRVVGLAISAGISTPGMCASLSYFDTYRRARLPANLVQAQRDLFGAHTYERIDRPGSFHTEWTKLARKGDTPVAALN